MPIPSAISEALAKVQEDADAYQEKGAQKATALQQAADAAHAAEVATNALAAAGQQLAGDRDALIRLVQQAYAT